MFPNLFMTIIIFNSLYAKQKQQQHFINFSHPSPSVSGNLQSIFCVYELRVFYLKKNFLYSIYKRDHIFLCWLISLSIMPLNSIHVVVSGKISSFLQLNNIPLYITICLFSYPLMNS